MFGLEHRAVRISVPNLKFAENVPMTASAADLFRAYMRSAFPCLHFDAETRGISVHFAPFHSLGYRLHMVALNALHEAHQTPTSCDEKEVTEEDHRRSMRARMHRSTDDLPIVESAPCYVHLPTPPKSPQRRD